jgi:hypothetical protein
LAKVQRASGGDASKEKMEKENQRPAAGTAAKSGQPGEDDDEVEDKALGKTVKKSKKEPLPCPVRDAQQHSMQQSSSFSNGFAAIADSFKPDTAEQFEAKAKAASKLIGSMFFG